MKCCAYRDRQRFDDLRTYERDEHMVTRSAAKRLTNPPRFIPVHSTENHVEELLTSARGHFPRLKCRAVAFAPVRLDDLPVGPSDPAREVECIDGLTFVAMGREVELRDPKDYFSLCDVDLELDGKVDHSFCEIDRELASDIVGKKKVFPLLTGAFDGAEQYVTHVDVPSPRNARLENTSS